MMQTRFEHHATSSMLCAEDAPPRRNGQLLFERAWEGRVFAVALALSRDGHYEWEDFRQSLITSIADWEAEHADWSRGWDYYQNWLQALERMVLAAKLVDPTELERRTATLLNDAHPPDTANGRTALRRRATRGGHAERAQGTVDR
jgi:nitrile hydratase accessory protein